MQLCIIDFIVQENGETTLKRIGDYTGIKKICTELTVCLLKQLQSASILILRPDGTVLGSIAKLTRIIEQEKTTLPNNHGKPWSENDIVLLAELSEEGRIIPHIAKKLHRTESSVTMTTSTLRKAYRLIPIIEKYKVVRDFASKQVSPNPER